AIGPGWGARVAGMVRGRTGYPLQERKCERAVLDQLVDAARDTRRGGVLVLRGEPGIGKTALLEGVDHLPGPQHEAIRVAFGLIVGPAPDRFLVGLAVLGLLNEAAKEQSVVCAIDDAQWLDRTSAQVLGFVARRLDTEPVVLIFAVREPDDHPDLAGLPELLVEGLN